MTNKEALDILTSTAGLHAQYLDKEEIKQSNEALSHYDKIINCLEVLDMLKDYLELESRYRTAILKIKGSTEEEPIYGQALLREEYLKIKEVFKDE